MFALLISWAFSLVDVVFHVVVADIRVIDIEVVDMLLFCGCVGAGVVVIDAGVIM